MSESSPWYEIRSYLQEKVTALLYEVDEQPEQPGKVLYFQGRGGLGKTFLLAHLHELPVVRELRALPCTIEDMAYHETRKPLELEVNLARNLLRLAEEHGLADAEVRAAFDVYEGRRQTYLTYHRNNPDSEQQVQADEARKQCFATAWNAVSARRLLVGRFDTMEVLIGKRPPDALISQPEAVVGMRAVVDWFTDVLPRLRHTLTIFAGRSPADLDEITSAGTNGDDWDETSADALDSSKARHNLLDRNELAARLVAKGILVVENFEIVQRLETDSDLLAYLAYYGLPKAPHSLHYIRSITDGVPLLLTLYAESQRPVALPFTMSLEATTSRRLFEDLLVDTVLNPLRYAESAGTADRRRRWLAYCLHILSFARRGLSVDDLSIVLARVEPGALVDDDLLAELDKLALVRQMPAQERYRGEGALRYLHDEIWLLIDATPIAEELGFREVILATLEGLSRERVARIPEHERPSRLLRAMCDHVYYAVARDVARGYRYYLVYMDHLFGQRNYEDALVLADVFWRMLSLRVVRFDRTTTLYRTQVAESLALSVELVRRYDQLHYVKLLLARGLNKRAVAAAEQLYAELVLGEAGWAYDEGVTPRLFTPRIAELDVLYSGSDGLYLPLSERAGPQRPALTLSREQVQDWPDEPHLAADLLRTWAHALTLRGADPDDLTATTTRAEQLFALVELLLGDADAVERALAESRARLSSRLRRDDNLLRLRRLALLGLTYQLDGQRLRQRLEYEEALDRIERSIQALQVYDNTPAALPDEATGGLSARGYLNDHVSDEIGLGLNNRAFLDAEMGQLERALRRTEEILRTYKDKLRPYYQTLMLNTRMEILMRADQFLAAAALLEEAEETARRAEVPRAQGLVALTRARIERWRMNQAREPRHEVNAIFHEACTLLNDEEKSYRLALDERVRFLRDLAFWYEQATPPDEGRRKEALREANDVMQEALEKLEPGPLLALLWAELKETAVTLLVSQRRYAEAEELLDQIEAQAMGQPMPLDGQIVAGKLALQRAICLLRDAGHAAAEQRLGLEQLMLAMARVYTLGETHHIQRSFETLARRLLGSHAPIPPELVAQFVADLDREVFIIARSALPYQNDPRLLTNRRWNEGWERAIRFFKTLAAEPLSAVPQN